MRRLYQRIKTEHVSRRTIQLYSTSQVGQDVWVYSEVFGEMEGGFFLDVGAHDGFYLSNTFLLEKRYHWRGICVEGNPLTFPKLQKNRDCTCLNLCVDGQSGTVDFVTDGVMGGILAEDCDNQSTDQQTVPVTTEPLEKILSDQNAPSTIDYFSIDIEGAEDRALMNFPFDRYTFNAMTIERPSPALRQKLQANGYILIKEIPELDCFYLHESYLPRYRENKYKFFAKHYLLLDNQFADRSESLFGSRRDYFIHRLIRLLRGKG